MTTLSETTFFLDRSSGMGLQAQIRESVVSAVLSGQIMPGVRMPSTRRLAEYLNVARITVTLAYQELVSQGYLEVSHRRAYRVAGDPPAASRNPDLQAPSSSAIDWADRLPARLTGAGRIRKPLDWRRYRYPFLYGQVDPSLFDLAAWRDCVRRAHGREDFLLMAGDFAAEDDPQFVNYICSRTLPSRGIRARPDEILVTVGAQNALWLIAQLLLGPGAHAVCENPCHPDIHATLRLSGATVSTVDVDARGLPPAALPDDIDALFITPSHHSPTTVTMPIERRQELLALARERDFVIVEDDYEFEVSFLEPTSPALKSLDRDDRVIHVGSFSKSMFPGLRLGYLVAAAPLIREARALRALMLRHPPGHLQRTTAYYLALGHHDAIIHRMRAAYARRHVVMAEALHREGIRNLGSSDFGGTSFWIEGPEGLDADLLVDVLAEQGVLIESGAPFFAESDRPCRHFRMAYSSIAAERIPEGVALTAAAIRSLV